MDNAFWVVIGSALTVAGGCLKDWFGWKREDDTRRRALEKDQQDWERLCEKEDKAFIRDAYQRTILNLSLLEAARPKDTRDILPDTKGFEIFQEAQKSLAVLCLRHPDPEFLKVLDCFVDRPYSSSLNDTRKYVLSMAAAEPQLFMRDTLEVDKKPASTTNLIKGERVFTVEVDVGYQQQRAIDDGKEVPSSSVFRCHVAEMTPTQRKKMMDAHGNRPNVPNHITMVQPTLENGAIVYRTNWKARLAPDECNPAEILQAWETEFDEALMKATNELGPLASGSTAGTKTHGVVAPQ